MTVLTIAALLVASLLAAAISDGLNARKAHNDVCAGYRFSEHSNKELGSSIVGEADDQEI